MKHQMKLNPRPFCSIISGKKTVEMRLCDEKRSKIKIGDKIEFCQRETGEKLLTRVVNLAKFSSFEELYAHFDKIDLGYETADIADPQDMYKYYSINDINKYGTLAIEIKLI